MFSTEFPKSCYLKREGNTQSRTLTSLILRVPEPPRPAQALITHTEQTTCEEAPQLTSRGISSQRIRGSSQLLGHLPSLSCQRDLSEAGETMAQQRLLTGAGGHPNKISIPSPCTGAQPTPGSTCSPPALMPGPIPAGSQPPAQALAGTGFAAPAHLLSAVSGSLEAARGQAQCSSREHVHTQPPLAHLGRPGRCHPVRLPAEPRQRRPGWLQLPGPGTAPSVSGFPPECSW